MLPASMSRVLRGGIGEGPRAVEEALLAELAETCAAATRDPAQLARPVRVVVPSQLLRSQLAARLLERTGGGVLGLRVQTLESVAREVLARAGCRPADERLAAVALRAAARRAPALARDLDPLDDGYLAAAAAVDDLLDAGFQSLHAAPLDEILTERSGSEVSRARALVRVAATVARELEAGTLGHRCALYAGAAERLRSAGADALPSRAVCLHGFADATGVQLDLLEALRTVLDAALWIDLPEGRDWRFGSRLRERLAPGRASTRERAPAAHCERSVHADRESEAGAAARWAREQLEAGIAPERVALVVRDLATHRLVLRRQLARHAVPFSGGGEPGAALPAARRLEACWALIERGSDLAAERWLEARGDLVLAERADLRDACLVLGASSLGAVAALGDAQVSGPIQLGGPAALETGADGAPRLRRRSVAAGALRELRARARDTLRHLESWPVEASLAERAGQLAGLAGALGWSEAGAERGALAEVCTDPERAGGRPISSGDWIRFLRRQLAGAGRDELGGQGGGVQVLSAMEARGLSFEALWVLGLERGVFPRRISEDALLPDAVRLSLRVVLPDLPVKSEGHDEERFLFAQLLAAAPSVHVSRARLDPGGRPVQASPLFEALSGSLCEFEPAPPPRRLGSQELARVLVRARRSAGLPAGDAEAAARARLATVAELESRRPALGPYLGVVGPPKSVRDPRRAPAHVTLLEATARCPWQAFLTRLLRLTAPRDPGGPLPEASDRRLLGNAVHAALESLCEPGQSGSWPGRADPERIEAAAARVLRREGIALPGYERALARRAARLVEVARRLDAESDWRASAVEVKGRAAVADAAGADRTLHFRADREERGGGGRRLTDWKTGALKLAQRSPVRRAEALRRQVASGAMLQAHAYARSGAAGRYLYLDPDAQDALRELVAEPDGPQGAAFESAVAALLGALDAGAFPPRLRRADRDEEPGACRTCEVKQACLRGDSGARARLGAWADARARSALGSAARELWWLGVEA